MKNKFEYEKKYNEIPLYNGDFKVIKSLENLNKLGSLGLEGNNIPKNIEEQLWDYWDNGYDAELCVQYCRDKIPKEKWKEVVEFCQKNKI